MTASPVEASSPSQSIMELEREYLLQNYARYPLALHRGKGAAIRPYSRLIATTSSPAALIRAIASLVVSITVAM